MLVIGGSIVLLVAIVGVLSNRGAAHPLTEFSVFGYHLTWSTGTLFLFGIAVGAVASLGLIMPATGVRRTNNRAHDSRSRPLLREMAFINRDRDTRLEHQQRVDQPQ
jgi:hypothetical protein